MTKISTTQEFLTQFATTGQDTTFHNRHINPQILVNLDGKNWAIDAYVKRGGYSALKKILSALISSFLHKSTKTFLSSYSKKHKSS